MFVRQGQIRYTTGSFQFAAENPQTTVTAHGRHPRHLDAIRLTAWAAAYKHNWNARWRSSLILSQLLVDNETANSGKAVTRVAQSASVNVIKQVADKLLVGIELRPANQELESGADGDLDRLQFSARYDF